MIFGHHYSKSNKISEEDIPDTLIVINKIKRKSRVTGDLIRPTLNKKPSEIRPIIPHICKFNRKQYKFKSPSAYLSHMKRVHKK